MYLSYMSHFYNTLEAILIVVLIAVNIPEKPKEVIKPNTCEVYKCMCKQL